MSLVISPGEVDALVRRFDALLRKFADSKNYVGWRVEKFEESLLNCRFTPEKTYGQVPDDTAVLKFFAGGQVAEKRLADIRQKNEELGVGNIKVNGTSIELINYSYCPSCGETFGFKEVQSYFRNPPTIKGMERRQQYLHDTRMRCPVCETFFVPSLVICSGAPRSEVQDLCRVQTVWAIEELYAKQGKKVLTRNPNNIKVNRQGMRAIINDIYIDDLRDCPTLIANMIKHTPENLVPSFISAKNVPNKNLLFGLWM